ncbi:branched-chain amino acid ABC transporter permease [Castellaniella sp.]|uniref:branched-chain amino acid ABC transporter permease n=1 Tax=Castellaniella sp. TaxID=1955812 RepID=UPI00355E15ED
MIDAMLSGDRPASRWLSAVLLLLLACLAGGPFLFADVRAFTLLGTMGVFILVAAAYDLMLGYAHMVSFAHTLFFALGAYGVALATLHLGPTLTAVAVGVGLALLFSLLLALVLGALTLRVQAIFFALATLAVAFACLHLVLQAYPLTGGADGLRVRLPAALGPGHDVFQTRLPGLDVPRLLRGLWSDPATAWEQARYSLRFTGRHLVYYASIALALGGVLLLLRVVRSPFGQVLLAIRENEFRARALGYRTVRYRTAAVVLAGLLTCLAGAAFALFNRYVSPTNTLSFDLMVFILLMCVIGGMGTLYGAVLGAALFLLAQGYLQDVLAVLAELWPEQPLWQALFAPQRWLLWLGLLFVLCVYWFPDGIVGRLRAARAKNP